MRPQTYFILLFLHVAALRPDSLFTRGLLFQDGLPGYQPSSSLGHSGAFLHTDEVSPGTQLQDLPCLRLGLGEKHFIPRCRCRKQVNISCLLKGKNGDMDIP